VFICGSNGDYNVSDKQRQLFKTKIVPGKPGSGKLFEEEFVVDDGPVECLGMTFENDEKRREYFLEKLREKLKDPEFRKIEGFPIGEDEDILALSDPPYYTACPNPFIENFIKHYGKPYDPATDDYRREPFAADVSEGKNDPIYNAHSYHTKVPHKAIMRYILHYTEPGDIVFDGFCGTGMTGVAAQMCGDKAVVESLGYQVKPDGTILRQETDENEKSVWVVFSKLGPRLAVLNDLSPAATFIAYNYNTPVDVVAFKREAKRILKEVEEECGWMYETLHADRKTKGRINCTVWSDVFICPECGGEIVYWDAAIDTQLGSVMDSFACPQCHVELTRQRLEYAWSNSFDQSLNKAIRQTKQVPVLIVYTIEGQNARFRKPPDKSDLDLIEQIGSTTNAQWHPIIKIQKGDKTGEPLRIGITHIHHFYTMRNLISLSSFLSKIEDSPLSRKLRYQFDSLVIRQSKRTRLLVSYFFHGGGGWVGTPLSGNLYVPSFSIEVQPFETWRNRVSKTLARVTTTSPFACFTSSTTRTNIPCSSIDYLFFDPPFGSNLQYSELNILWESWLRVATNQTLEAVENRTQKKGALEYRNLMNRCFVEAYRVLKPGRWITVEFSNTKAAVWNSIQTALAEAGFIVANVSALDKKQGSFNAVTNTISVKQDLVISAYKPNGGFEERFLNEATTEEGVWDFIRTHLKYLPVAKKQGGDLVPVPERDPRILFDQMVAYYVRAMVCISCPTRRLSMTRSA
jgi:DNA modification methylase